MEMESDNKQKNIDNGKSNIEFKYLKDRTVLNKATSDLPELQELKYLMYKSQSSPHEPLP